MNTLTPRVEDPLALLILNRTTSRYAPDSTVYIQPDIKVRGSLQQAKGEDYYYLLQTSDDCG